MIDDLHVMQNVITGFVPYLHVRNVLESCDFYSRFGLELDSRFGDEGAPYWARMKAPGCDLMLAAASGDIDPRAQAVLFYLYVPDLRAFRADLLKAGVVDGGRFGGESTEDFPRCGKAFEIEKRFYMPAGEMRVHDPDGYVLLVGQLGEP